MKIVIRPSAPHIQPPTSLHGLTASFEPPLNDPSYIEPCDSWYQERLAVGSLVLPMMAQVQLTNRLMAVYAVNGTVVCNTHLGVDFNGRITPYAGLARLARLLLARAFSRYSPEIVIEPQA